MKAIELEPLNLGEMEKRTPEFQRLTVANKTRGETCFFLYMIGYAIRQPRP